MGFKTMVFRDNAYQSLLKLISDDQKEQKANRETGLLLFPIKDKSSRIYYDEREERKAGIKN